MRDVLDLEPDEPERTPQEWLAALQQGVAALKRRQEERREREVRVRREKLREMVRQGRMGLGCYCQACLKAIADLRELPH